MRNEKMVQRKYKIELWKSNGGAKIEEEITYYGTSYKDIAKQVDRDEEEILYYMQTGDMKKQRCFCFNGLMINKAGIVAIRLSEADY